MVLYIGCLIGYIIYLQFCQSEKEFKKSYILNVCLLAICYIQILVSIIIYSRTLPITSEYIKLFKNDPITVFWWSSYVGLMFFGLLWKIWKKSIFLTCLLFFFFIYVLFLFLWHYSRNLVCSAHMIFSLDFA